MPIANQLYDGMKYLLGAKLTIEIIILQTPHFRPECWFKPQFIYRLYQNTNIVAENLTKDFINLSDRGFSPYRTSELALNHGEGGLDIRPFVIMSKEGFPIEVVEVPHPLPESIKGLGSLTTLRVTSERDIGCGIYRLNSVEILFAGVGFVSRHFIDGESLGSGIYQLGKLRGIRCLSWCGLNASYNMSFDTAHQVGFNPFGFAPHFTPFVVEPSVIGCSREARGINGKVGLYGSERAGTLLNERFEKHGQFRVFKVSECAVVMRSLRNHPCVLSLFQLSCEPAS